MWIYFNFEIQEIKESENLVNVLFNFQRFKDIVMPPPTTMMTSTAVLLVYPQ